MTVQQELDRIAAAARACAACGLCEGRKQAVPGVGNPHAAIMFVGEAPGAKEDDKGEPFVGAAGKVLDKLLVLAGLTRADVFIANTVKCRPPDNRDPLPEEKAACRPFLEAQFAAIKPKLIVTLGRHAMYNFLPATISISAAHGQPKRVIDPETGALKYYLYPVFHPAAALYNPNQMDGLRKDFARLPAVLEEIAKREEK